VADICCVGGRDKDNSNKQGGGALGSPNKQFFADTFNEPFRNRTPWDTLFGNLHLGIPFLVTSPNRSENSSWSGCVDGRTQWVLMWTGSSKGPDGAKGPFPGWVGHSIWGTEVDPQPHLGGESWDTLQREVLSSAHLHFCQGITT